jgi:hypothetical protein
MTHRETKKATKRQDKHHTKPSITEHEDVQKTLPKGIIKGTE